MLPHDKITVRSARIREWVVVKVATPANEVNTGIRVRNSDFARAPRCQTSRPTRGCVVKSSNDRLVLMAIYDAGSMTQDSTEWVLEIAKERVPGGGGLAMVPHPPSPHTSSFRTEGMGSNAPGDPSGFM